MHELSIFVDESGDFGEFKPHSPYYIISMVMHDQAVDIGEDLAILERELTNCGFPHHCVHTGPLIRGEFEYRNISIDDRKKILRRLMTFFRHLDIHHKTFYIEKNHIEDAVAASGILSKQISGFIKEHLTYFVGFDKVIIYYDNGQVEVNKILASIFNVLLDNIEFRRVMPSDYRLFQIADLMCTLQLMQLKNDHQILTRSEQYFFENKKTLKKHYLRFFDYKEMK